MLGITTDPSGNIYFVGTNNNGSFVAKYGPAPTYTLCGTSLFDNFEDGMGYNRIRGIIYSESSGLLYASTTSPIDDCVSAFDTSLMYLGAAVPPTGTGDDASKGIAITTECCPISNDISIDTVFCDGSVIGGEPIFLDDLLDCQGTICQGGWTEESADPGIVYDPCTNSITINATGCSTFSLSSDGTGANAQCGSFTITLNVAVENIEASVIGSQIICSGEDPDPIQIIVPAMGTGPISYQWQESTVDCNTGFVDIPGATSETFDPPSPTMSTFYRVVTTVNAGSCSSGSCSDISNCIMIEVQDLPVITLDPAGPFCIDATSTDLSATPSGGIFSGTGITDVNAGTFDPATAGAGTHTINYTFTTTAVVEEVVTDLEAFDINNFSFINSMLNTNFGDEASLFNNVDETGGATFHANRIDDTMDWGIAYQLSQAYNITDLGLDRRNNTATNRGEGGVFQVFNAGVLVYQGNIISGPGDNEIFTTPTPNVVGDEVRYIFENGADTGQGDGTLNFTEFIIMANTALSCTNSATIDIVVNPLPNCNAGPSMELTCTATTVTLAGSSTTSGATFSWATSDGTIDSGGSTATPTVSAPGTYTLTVTSNGCTSTCDVVVTQNIAMPNCNAGSTMELTCATTSVMLAGSSTTSGATFSWATSDGTIDSGGASATPTVSAPGTYTLTVTDPSNGCTSTCDVVCLLYTSPSPRDRTRSRMPSSA